MDDELSAPLLSSDEPDAADQTPVWRSKLDYLEQKLDAARTLAPKLLYDDTTRAERIADAPGFGAFVSGLFDAPPCDGQGGVFDVCRKQDDAEHAAYKARSCGAKVLNAIRWLLRSHVVPEATPHRDVLEASSGLRFYLYLAPRVGLTLILMGMLTLPASVVNPIVSQSTSGTLFGSLILCNVDKPQSAFLSLFLGSFAMLAYLGLVLSAWNYVDIDDEHARLQRLGLTQDSHPLAARVHEFSVAVTGFPVTTVQDMHAFFSRYGEVVSITAVLVQGRTLARGTHTLRFSTTLEPSLIAKHDQMRQRALSQPSGQPLLDDMSAVLLVTNLRAAQLCAFVTFSRVSERDLCLERINAGGVLSRTCCPQSIDGDRYRGVFLTGKPADQPSDIVYRHYRYRSADRYLRRLASLVSSGMLLSSTVVLSITIEGLLRRLPNFFSRLAISSLLLVLNNVWSWCFTYLAKMEKHRSITRLQKSAFWKSVIYNVLNTVVVLIAVENRSSDTGVSGSCSWLSQVASVVVSACSIKAFLEPVSRFFFVGDNVRTCWRFVRKRGEGHLRRADDLWLPFSFTLHTRFTYLMYVLILTLWFASAFPFVYLVSGVGVVAVLLVDIYNLRFIHVEADYIVSGADSRGLCVVFMLLAALAHFVQDIFFWRHISSVAKIVNLASLSVTGVLLFKAIGEILSSGNVVSRSSHGGRVDRKKLQEVEMQPSDHESSPASPEPVMTAEIMASHAWGMYVPPTWMEGDFVSESQVHPEGVGGV